MTKYRVKKIDTRKANTIEDYNILISNAPIIYCNGIKELETYCGGKLHKQRCGYSGIIANFEYIAEKC